MTLHDDIEKSGKWFSLIPAAVHIGAALVAAYGFGVSIGATSDNQGWDFFWQNLPVEDLQSNFLQSIWHLHAQPPLYNVYGGLLIRMFYPNYLEWIHVLNVAMGAAMVAMASSMIAKATQSARTAMGVALIWAVHPSLLLYEAFVLYTVLTAFLITLLVFLTVRGLERPHVWIWLAVIGVANALILTRSLYYVALLIPLLALFCNAAGNNWKRVLIGGLCISMVSVGWYGKNAVQYGPFTASTWGGWSLWKIVTWGMPQKELDRLAQKGTVDPMVTKIPPFSTRDVYVP